MIKKSINKLLLVSATIVGFSANVFALNDSEKSVISIPMMENAQVFADFTDGTPAVLNYFTSATETQVIDFYQEQYGDAVSQERKRGRLTLSYQQETHHIRVVISQQNNKRQVDVIVEKKT